MMFKREEGFTLVELMVVVLIIGILVAIAVPVFLSASANAEAKSCQANQRTIVGAMTTAYANDAIGADMPNEVLNGGAAVDSLDAALITEYIKAAPKCKTQDNAYYVAKIAGGVPSVTGDNGDDTAPVFITTPAHALP